MRTPWLLRVVVGLSVAVFAPVASEAVVPSETCSGPAFSVNFTDADSTSFRAEDYAPATMTTCPGSMFTDSGFAPDLVYRIAAAQSGMVTVVADPEFFDLVLYVMTPTCPSGVFTQYCIAGADSGVGGTAEQVTFTAVAGHEYFVVVDGWSGHAGRFTVAVTGLLSPWDIDGDGEVEPLTDGLLMLRWEFGFTGATLINGAVDLGHCFRCSASAVESYLAGFKPSL